MKSLGRLILQLSSFILRFALIALAAANAFALDVPPPPTQWFTDRAGLVSASDADALNRKLEAFEQSSGAQFIIYVFPSLQGESMEDFTIRAAERWKVGNAKYDNGLILFVFVQEQKMRIEVGYGLEGTVTDAISSRVMRESIAPRFAQNDWAGGLNAGADALIARITKGEAPVDPVRRRTGAEQIGTRDINPLFVILIVFFVFFILVPALTRGGRRGRPSGCGGCFWPMFFFPGGGGGGFTIGHGGGGFGGGFGGGGFSGGGGSFGGGGASGGW